MCIRDRLKDLEKAQKFIFMEYHAIEDAEAWHKIQDFLEERVKAGVEGRVFYDDMGSIGFINTDFVKKMEAIGIPVSYTHLDVYKRQIKGKPARVPGTNPGNSDSLSVCLLSAPFLDITFSPHLQFCFFFPESFPFISRYSKTIISAFFSDA